MREKRRTVRKILKDNFAWEENELVLLNKKFPDGIKIKNEEELFSLLNFIDANVAHEQP